MTTISRRQFLTLGKDIDPLLKNISPHARKATSAARPTDETGVNCESITAGITPYTGTFGRSELIHLLKRAMFGVKKADIDFFAGKTVSEVVDTLTATSSFPTALTSYPLRDYASPYNGGTTASGAAKTSSIDWGDVPMGGEWGKAGTLIKDCFSGCGDLGINDTTADNFWRDRSLQKWNLGLHLNQDRSVFEKLVLFWLNHFAYNSITQNYSQRSFTYVQLVRTSVNADLRDFAKGITKNPGYLMYLNGRDNTKNAPDENFAREIQELFCIGKEVPFDKRYTEDDVKAFAKALTGHSDQPSGFLGAGYQFIPSNHQGGNKQLSAFYSNKVITGATNPTATSGDDELNQLINVMFDDVDKNITTLVGTEFEGWSRADVVADFIVKKIYRTFCFSYIDQNTKTNIIKPLANLYKQSSFKLLPVVKALLKSEHFFHMRNRGALIKAPYDATIGLLRTTDGEAFVNNTTDAQQRYTHLNALHQQTLGMGGGAIESPNVAGWAPYYQEPQYHQLWLNSDTLPKRQDFAKRYCGNGGAGTWDFTSYSGTLDHIAFCKTLTNPSDPNALIDELGELFLGIPLTANQKSTLKTQALLNNQTQDSYWTQAWTAAAATNASATAKTTATNLLKKLFDTMVRLEEFQLM
jgi:uncharacterized protein (DUF1800 family)